MLFQIKTINGQKTIVPLTADTGTGAPVGSIIVVCSNILPNGYLGLGVQYDITNYPALYQVLGTDTTPTASSLGLPTLSSGQYAIKATSGLTENQQENVLNTINENNSYSTEEHATGKKWIDGKPIYSKTFYSATGWTNGALVGTIADFDKLISTSCVSRDGNNNCANNLSSPTSNEVFTVYVNKTQSTIYTIVNNIQMVEGYVTIEYTKTTDN